MLFRSDRESDIRAGLNAGIRAAAVCTGKLDAEGWAKVLPAGVPVFAGLMELVAALPAVAEHA